MTTPAGGGRRAARERALSLLYEAETKDAPIDEVLAALPLAPDPFTVAVVRGVAGGRPQLDELIVRFARDWRLERMPVLDRTVLRMAIEAAAGKDYAASNHHFATDAVLLWSNAGSTWMRKAIWSAARSAICLRWMWKN